MQQEFAREPGEISPSVFSFGVDEPQDSLLNNVKRQNDKKFAIFFKM